MKKEERVVVTVLGKDRVGIVSGISEVLAENSVNILDLASTKMRDLFVMIMLIDISQAKVTLEELQSELKRKAEAIGVQVSAQHENIFRYMHRI